MNVIKILSGLVTFCYEYLRKMHLARKKLIYLPVEYQEELDFLALSIRRESKQKIEELKSEVLNLRAKQQIAMANFIKIQAGRAVLYFISFSKTEIWRGI